MVQQYREPLLCSAGACHQLATSNSHPLLPRIYLTVSSPCFFSKISMPTFALTQTITIALTSDLTPTCDDSIIT